MDPSPYGSDAPKEFVTKRFKLVWRILLISNLGLGAYIFAKARRKALHPVEHKGVRSDTVHGDGTKSSKVEDEEIAKASEIEVAKPEQEETKVVANELSMLSEYADAAEEPIFPTVTTVPAKIARKPIPEDEQRELFKWILAEKRKIKPKDREEKKRVDEEKAILKQFIRAEKIPKFIPDDSFDSSLRDWDKFFSQ